MDKEKVEEDLLSHFQTTVDYQERVIGNREGMELISGLQVSFFNPQG